MGIKAAESEREQLQIAASSIEAQLQNMLKTNAALMEQKKEPSSTLSSAMRLSQLAQEDLEASGRQRDQDLHMLRISPKPDFLRALPQPAAKTTTTTAAARANQTIAEMISYLESNLHFLRFADRDVFRRITVLLELSIAELEKCQEEAE